MNLLPDDLRARLLANGAAEPEIDHVPVLKLFNPLGPARWLITELMEDEDTLFGLCDLGMGCPELGYVSLAEITAVRLPMGLGIERDLYFESRLPLSAWAEAARRAGSILDAELLFRQLARDASNGGGS